MRKTNCTLPSFWKRRVKSSQRALIRRARKKSSFFWNIFREIKSEGKMLRRANLAISAIRRESLDARGAINISNDSNYYIFFFIIEKKLYYLYNKRIFLYFLL